MGDKGERIDMGKGCMCGGVVMGRKRIKSSD